MAGPLRGTGEGAGSGALVPGPALGLLELRSIARGIVLSDAVVKRAAVRLCLSRPVSPGKHLTLFCGGVADVEEAFQAGLAVAQAGSALCDSLLLAQVHEEVLAALAGTGALAQTRAAVLREEADVSLALNNRGACALAIVETFSAAAALLSADAACKAAAVRLHTLRLCDGLGGKAYYVLCGSQADSEAALQAAEAALTPGLLFARELIARPHPDLLSALADG